MPLRLAIIGPGAVGGSIAAHLLNARRHEIALAVRTPFAVLDLDSPEGEHLRFKPDLLTSAIAPANPFDWVLVTTKAYDVAGTVPWLNALVGPQTQVAILQNGVEHVARFAPFVDPARLLPVMVDLPAERTGPGCIHQRRTGFLRTLNTPPGQAFINLFAGTPLDAATEADFTTALWRKLTLNAPGALNALTLIPNRLIQVPSMAELMRTMMLEVIAVGRAEGAQLADSLADEILANQRQASPDGVNSLHADRLAGRTMEADARNGAVVRAGQRHGIPTPLNTMALTLLESLQPRPNGAV